MELLKPRTLQGKNNYYYCYCYCYCYCYYCSIHLDRASYLVLYHGIIHGFRLNVARNMSRKTNYFVVLKLVLDATKN